MKKVILISLVLVLFFSSFTFAAFNQERSIKTRDLKYREGIDNNGVKLLPYYGEDQEIINLPYYHNRLDKPYNLRNHIRKNKKTQIFNSKKINKNVFQIL